MHRVPLIVSLALIPCAAAAQAKTTTKIESQLLVTGETGMQFSVSPHGGHLAAVTQKGSRWLVIFDGTAGPLFDEIAMPSGGGDKVTWSPDGSRYAYVGRVGEQYSVMVDGKEQLKVPATNETGVAQIQGKGRTNITFTPDSKHIFYGIQTVGPGPGGAKFMQNQIVYDGVVEPPDQGDGQTMVYGAEGPHHAYLIMARASTALNRSGQNKTLLVVDGKLAPYTAGTLQYTADGTHLFSQVVSNVPGKGSAFQLLVDGRPVMRAQGIRVYMAPVGDGFVAVVSQQGPGGTPNQFLVHGATRVAGSDCGGFGYDSGVLFSADGKHYAAPCKTTAASVAMVIDGKKGREYQNITEFAFSPDGTHSMYKATSGKTFVVTGEAESDGYQILDSLRFGGAHTGFIATKASGSAPWEVVIDGKPVPRTDTQVASLFRMSADGAHWAYLTGYGNAVGLVLDGTDQGLSMVNGFERSFRGKRFVFSPDGKHFATFGTPKAMPDATGILFDSKFLKLGVQYVFHPTFTPDGRHFLFLTEDPGNAKESIYVDGKVVAQVDANTSLADNPAAWEMGADGVLTLVAQDAGAIKRFRLTPGSDASIETLLALAKKP